MLRRHRAPRRARPPLANGARGAARLQLRFLGPRDLLAYPRQLRFQPVSFLFGALRARLLARVLPLALARLLRRVDQALDLTTLFLDFGVHAFDLGAACGHLRSHFRKLKAVLRRGVARGVALRIRRIAACLLDAQLRVEARKSSAHLGELFAQLPA